MRNNLAFLLIAVLVFNAAMPAAAQDPAKESHGIFQPGLFLAQLPNVAPPNPDQVAPVAPAVPKTPLPNAEAAVKNPVTQALPSNEPHSAVLKYLFDDDSDPLTLYFMLPVVSIWRLNALRSLWTSIPAASRAKLEFKSWNFNSSEMKKVKATLKILQKTSAAKIQKIVDAAEVYDKRLHEVDVLTQELRGHWKISGDKKTLQRLDNAIESWTSKMDFAPLAAFVSAERNGGRFKGKLGQTWLTNFDLWSAGERADAQPLAESWNDLVADINKGMSTTTQEPSLRIKDQGGNHSPGDLYANGIGTMKHSDIARKANETCFNSIKQLGERRIVLRGQVGPLGLLNQSSKIVMPFGTVSLSGFFFWLHLKTYRSSLKKYNGKSPEVARAENTLKATVENEVTIRAESSIDAQVEKYQDQLAPFVDLVAANLSENGHLILNKLEEYKKLNPEANIDAVKIEALFKDTKLLKKKVREVLPYASQKLGKDLSVNQLLSFLALITKPETQKDSEDAHKRFLYAIYSKLLDNALPELESAIEVQQELITVGAGQHFSKLYKNELVPKLLPELRKMKITDPTNVTPLPVLPLKEPDAAGPTLKAVSLNENPNGSAPTMGKAKTTELVSTPVLSSSTLIMSQFPPAQK